MQLMALRLRMQGTQVFILTPIKGHEFADACYMAGGKYIRIAPSSKDCINIMEIRKSTLSPDYEIKGDDRGDSVLAEKLQKLMIFFFADKKRHYTERTESAGRRSDTDLPEIRHRI